MRKNETYNVCVIVEGNEEECLFNIVKEFGVHESIDLSVLNAMGASNIGPYYQYQLNDDVYDCVVCVYDVDFKFNEESSAFNKVRNDLYSILGDYALVDSVSFCTNPNILQILLLGCDDLSFVKLNSASKKENTKIVNRYWNKIGKQKKNQKGQPVCSYYDASKWQLRIIEDSFKYEEYSYATLLNNSLKLDMNYKNYTEPGSNIISLLLALKNGDIQFFKNINSSIYSNDCQ